MRTLFVVAAIVALVVANTPVALVFAVLALAYERQPFSLGARLRAALDRERERRAGHRSEQTSYDLDRPPIDR